jgi:hypothetical protein
MFFIRAMEKQGVSVQQTDLEIVVDAVGIAVRPEPARAGRSRRYGRSRIPQFSDE